jgi:lantibiotic biosynthesis protein
MEVGSRLQSRERVEEAARKTRSQTGFPHTFRWQPKSIASGFSGIALLHKQLHIVSGERGWEETARQFILLALADAEGSRASDIGLFSGLAGVGFAAYSVLNPDDCLPYLGVLERDLSEQSIKQMEALSRLRSGVAPSTFDVISGFSGVGAYLLLRRSDPDCRRTLDKLIFAAVALAEEDDGLPRWRTPGHLMVDPAMRQRYPHGNLNLGLAHGLPGIIAFLALCVLDGVSTEAILPTLRRTSAWLSQNRCDDQWGINWPNAVALTPLELNGDGSRLTSEKTLSGPSRAAWCYGAPGIARALSLAGLALQDSNLIEIAVSSLHAVTRRPKADRAIDSPTFCHGVAGLLQIMLRSVNETEDSLLIGEVRLLVEQILSLWDPESYLGFRSIEPGERFVDQPGFLDGAAGVAITLLSAASDEPPSWDRLFMLA